MPTIYSNTFTGTSQAVLNTIRDSASVNYREFVPIATEGGESVREIGAIIMQYPALQNEFLNFLMNRIGREIITSRMYENPLRMFKKGFLKFGETVEEIFVNLAQVYAYNPSTAATNVFNIETPDVKAAFHIMNVQSRYKQTVSEVQLRQAFLSWGNMDRFIRDGIIASMYKAVEYDEFQIMKYMLARTYLNGKANAITVADADTEPNNLAIAMRAQSSMMVQLNNTMNPSGVYNSAERNTQYLIIPAQQEAELDVNVLAAAFHMDKADFLGHIVPIDSFTNIDSDRLSNILEGFEEFTTEETTALGNLLAFLVDDNFFQIYDKLLEMRSIENSEGLYWNYNLHAWKICSTSPFANRVAFTQAAGVVTAVDITTPAQTLPYGQQLAMSAEVTATNGADKSLTWSLSATANGLATIDPVTGLITYNGTQASTNTAVTVQANSVAFPSKGAGVSIILAGSGT